MRSKRSKDRCADTEESLAWVSLGQEVIDEEWSKL